MTVTTLEKYKGQTFRVVVDDERTFYLHRNIIEDFGIKFGFEFNENLLEEILDASDRRKAWEYSLYLLDYRDHSYSELFEKLNKNYDDEVCYSTLDRLVKAGLVNDRRYAESLARKLIEGKKYGFYKASYEMQKKGLDRELCSEILAEYEDSADERLYILVGRQYGRLLADENNIGKVKSALVRKGYSYDSVNRAIDRFLFENED